MEHNNFDLVRLWAILKSNRPVSQIIDEMFSTSSAEGDTSSLFTEGSLTNKIAFLILMLSDSERFAGLRDKEKLIAIKILHHAYIATNPSILFLSWIWELVDGLNSSGALELLIAENVRGLSLSLSQKEVLKSLAQHPTSLFHILADDETEIIHNTRSLNDLVAIVKSMTSKEEEGSSENQDVCGKCGGLCTQSYAITASIPDLIKRSELKKEINALMEKMRLHYSSLIGKDEELKKMLKVLMDEMDVYYGSLIEKGETRAKMDLEAHLRKFQSDLPLEDKKAIDVLKSLNHNQKEPLHKVEQPLDKTKRCCWKCLMRL